MGLLRLPCRREYLLRYPGVVLEETSKVHRPGFGLLGLFVSGIGRLDLEDYAFVGAVGRGLGRLAVGRR